MHLALGDLENGRKALLKARDMNQKLVEENPNLFPAYEQMAFCVNLLAIGEMEYGEVIASIPFHQQTISLRRKMLTMNPAAQDCEYNLAQSYLALAAAHSILLEVDQSLAAINECVPLLEKATRDEPQLIWLRRDLAQAYGFRAQAHLNKERYEDALRDIELTKQLVAELSPQAPDDPFFAKKRREVGCLQVSALCELFRWEEALDTADSLSKTANDDPRILVELSDTLASQVMDEYDVASDKAALPEEWAQKVKSASLRLFGLAIQSGYDEATLPPDSAIQKLRKAD